MSVEAGITILNTRPGEEDEKGLDLYLKEEHLRDQAKDARELFNTIQDELEHREEDLKDGLSFLDMKNDTLLSYMIDVCNIVLLKVRGESIDGHPSVERCVEYRVILEKIKAIDQKLAYQLNKLITLPEDAEEEEQRIDVRNLDINLSNVETDAEDDNEDDEDDEDDEEEEDESSEDNEDGSGGSIDGSEIIDDSDDASDHMEKKPPKNQRKEKVLNIASKKGYSKAAGVYRPPKLRSVAYTEEGDSKEGSKGRRKNYDEFYQDEDYSGDIVEKTHNAPDDERVRFEEDNYTRLPDENPKKTKRKLKTKEYRKKGRKSIKRRRRK